MSDLSARWLPAAAALAAAAAVWPSLQSLWHIWRDVHDYQHGGLIALIAVLWFGMVLRRGLPAPARPSLAAAALLAGALGAWLVAFNAQSQMAHQLLAPAVIWLAVAGAIGPRAALALATPTGFLYFAVPIWDYAVPVLQQLSVWATEKSLGLFGIPAVMREYVVTIPEGSFRIVEGCSGKRFFMVTLAMAVLSAAVNGIRGWRYAVFVAACGLLAMLANYVRIFVVIYAGHVTNMQHYLVAVEHKSLGNGIFVLLLVAVFLLARRLSTPQPATVPPVVPTSPAQGSLAGAAVVFMLLAAAVVLVQARASAVVPAPRLGLLPVATEAWQGPLPPDPRWQPRYPGAADARRAAYASPAGTVELYVNVYGEQRQGEGELVYFGNSLLAPGEWQRAWPVVSRELEVASGPPFVSFEATDPGGQRWLIAQQYDVGGRLTASDALAQIGYGALSAFRPVPAGLYALAARCDGNCEATRALVKSFWDDMSSPVRGLRADGRSTVGD